MIELRLLGSPQIFVAGAPITGLPWAKSQALLFYLALRDRPLSRLALAGLLWPDKTDDEARTTLRQALRTVTKTFPNLIDSEGDSLVFNRAVGGVVDVQQFESAVQRGLSGDLHALHTAIDYYHGDFLAGFFVDDAPDFEEWVIYTRERLHGQALQALHQLSLRYLERRDVPMGLRYTRQLLAMEPWHEETHQQLMRLLAWDGQFSAALAQYQSCQRALEQELGLAPGPETAALRDRIERLRTIRRQNLPPEPTPLVGRAEPIAELTQLLQTPTTRLVTIIGPGGVGKTRVALAVARSLLNAFLEGVFWVDLTGTRTVTDLLATVATALGRPLAGRSDPAEQIVDLLRNKEMLLVLNNCESLLSNTSPAHGADVGVFIGRLLQQAPALTLLTTSRAPLHLRQERLFPLAPLVYPTLDSAQSQGDEAALELFVQVAQRGQPRFNLSAERITVATICRLVEGLPLGIELAAALTIEHSCAEIAQAISSNVQSLTARWHDAPPHQHSLSATFDYSLSLLPPITQALLIRLAVFVEGFTLDAATVATTATADQLAMLLAHSLVQGGGDERYKLHSLIRQFARVLLAQTPTVEAAVQSAHSRYFCFELGRQEAAFWREAPQRAQQWFQSELANVQAAWRWAATSLDLAALEAAAGSLVIYYRRNGPLATGEALLMDAVRALENRLATADSAATPNDTFAQTLGQLAAQAAQLLEEQGRYAEATTVAERALAVAEQLHAEPLQATARLTLARAATGRGEFVAAQEQAQRALQLAGQESALAAHGHMILAEVSRRQGRPQEALPLYEAALAGYTASGDLEGLAGVSNNLGMLYLDQNDLGQAQAMFTASLERSRQLGDRRREAAALLNLGIIHDYRGEYDQSRANYRQARQLAEALGNQDDLYGALTNLGMAAHLLGDFVTAEQYYLQVLTALRATTSHYQEGVLLANLALLAHQTGDQAAALRYSEEVVQLAVAQDAPYLKAYGLTFAAHAEAALGNLTNAATRYQEAVAIRRTMGAHNMAMESLAGWVRVLLQQGKTQATRPPTTEILDYLATQPQAEGTDEPFRLYLTCYQSLRANRDPRAPDLLQVARRLLHERAGRLQDEAARASFLHNIVTHRTLLASDPAQGSFV